MLRIIKPNTNINFMSKRHVFMGLSFLLLIISIFLFSTKGLNYGIDFTGGIELQVKFKNNTKIVEVRKSLSRLNLRALEVQSFGEENINEFLLRIKGQEEKLTETIKNIENNLSSSFGNDSYDVRKVDLVGPKVGKELRSKGFYAIIYALIGILIYIALRFDYKFSPGAVLAIVHDVLITIGIFSLFKIQFTLSTIAALLTIVGYSLNDTIVVYDRIRETMEKLKGTVFQGVINRAINDTLSRTILTSLTTLAVVSMLLLYGGNIIKDFALALFIGVVVGTYSSIFIASPVLLDIDKAMHKKKEKNNVKM
jgi:preprotein translocase subunit SecF